MFKLVIQDDEGKTTVVPLIRDEITIGRKEGNTIRLTERNVSRRHARILRNNGEVQIEDLGSYNGIRVNNARIAERVSLRVSDQVQIGDYKLYLKAEGVEQVDDARTMPIERIDADGALAAGTQPPAATPTNGTSTTAGAASAATVPLPVVSGTSGASGTTPPAAPVLVGTPGRTMVALSDAETVRAAVGLATAQAVAALNAPVGYGRLVVLSSNFAGKEFELSRPQMIIGRTDENDIVINHRSISRNHAKVVREPETGRYTVSDLQSSNGVRVNGQDYGKVELRRGDVVDLGHVRLRFVEPGEDFVFARDAVITDVPEAGSKRSLLLALLLGVVVLGGIGVYMMTRGSGGKDGTPAPDDHIVTPGPGSSQTPNIVPATGPGSASESGPQGQGSNGSNDPGGSGMVATTGLDASIGSGSSYATVASDDDKARKRAECKQLEADKKWQDLLNCAGELSRLGDTTGGTELKTRADSEQRNDVLDGRFATAIGNKDWADARKQLDKISDDSSYKKDDKARLDVALKAVIDDYRGRAKAFARAGKCKDVDALARQAVAVSAEAAEAVRTVHCEAPTAVPEHPSDHVDHVASVPTPANCDAGALAQKGKDEINVGQYAAALVSLEASLRCQQDPALYRLILLAACNSANAGKAKQYYAKLPTAQQSNASQMCIRNKIPLP